MQGAPKDAPAQLLRQIDSEAQAVAVSMLASGSKLAFVAKSLGRSVSYVSLIRNGKRPVPAWFVAPFCWVTGSNLLAQYRDLQRALRATTEGETARARVERIARELLRGVA